MTASPATAANSSHQQDQSPDAEPYLPVCISDWYIDLGAYSFPTVFVTLNPTEIQALANGTAGGAVADAVADRLDRVIGALPGSSFVHADACAPDDTPAFATHDIAVKTGKAAWKLLISSAKVRHAMAAGFTRRIGLHPYRRMDRVREFRIFIRDRRIVGMSQYNLQRHFGRLAGRRDEIWAAGQKLAAAIADALPRPHLTVDTYLTSSSELMILDMNPWGAPTHPLLYRDWDEHDWTETPSLRLIPKPIDLKGEVEVSF